MILFAVIVGLFGLIIGSFLNVVIYRVPNKISIVTPPSACPHCHAEIKPYDNIPLVSWLLLRGKCRNCKAPISVRYPLVELATGLFFGVVAWFAADAILRAETLPAMIAAILVLLAYLYLAAISIALALIDLDVKRLPNAIVLPAYIVAVVLFGIASILLGDYSMLVRAAISMVILAAAYFAMALAYPKGMGLGDVKLAGVLGFYLGWVSWGALAVGAFAAFILGGLYGVVLIVARRATRKSGIPFGPWMLVGAWIGIAVGTKAFDAYLSFIGLTAV